MDLRANLKSVKKDDTEKVGAEEKKRESQPESPIKPAQAKCVPSLGQTLKLGKVSVKHMTSAPLSI